VIAQRLLIALAACTALTLSGAAPAQAHSHSQHHGPTRRTQIRLVSVLHVDLRGSGLPRVTAKLGVTLPATDPTVTGLLADRHSYAYVEALRTLLEGFGAFPQHHRPVIAFAMPAVRTDVPEPRVQIRHGRAHTWIGVWTRVWNDGRLRAGPWFVETKGGRVDVWSTPAATLPGNVTLIQRVRVDGATDLADAPTPERRRGNRARWLGPVAVHVSARERAGTRWHVAAAGVGGDRRQRGLDAALLVLTGLWPFLALGGLRRGRWSWREDLRGEAAALTARVRTLARVAALLVALLALDVWRTNWGFINYEACGVIALGIVAFVLLLVRAPRARPPYAEQLLTLVVIGLLGTSLCQWFLPAYHHTQWASPMPVDWAVAISALGVFGLLALAAYATIAWALAPRRVPRAVPVLVAALAAALAAREIDAGLTVGRVVHLHQRLGLGDWRTTPQGYLVTDLYEYGASVLWYAVVTGVPLALLVVLMRLLALRARQAPGLLPDAQARRVIVVLFAVFVGGEAGVWGYTVPLSMWVAGIALGALLTARRGAAEALVAVLPDAELRRRGKWLRSGAPWGVTGAAADPVAPAQPSSGGGAAGRIGAALGRGAGQLAFGFQRGPWQPAPPRTTPSALLSAGPEADWWHNGMTAVRLGLIPALLPAAHYLWAVYAQSDPFAPGDSYALLDLAEAAVREYAFWLVGAFSFGALFVWLPGRPGIVKGLTPAAVFAISQLAVELMPGTFDAVNWPVLVAETGLYFAALGGIMDWWTLRSYRLPLRAVERIHGIDRTRLIVQYLSPIVVAAAFVLQQAATGEAQRTVSNIVEIASGQQPPPPPAQRRGGG
jgi:hypothetical protein